MADYTPLGQISESDFSVLLKALSSTSKGRAFLNHYRESFRPEETANLLGSLRGIEKTVEDARDQLKPKRIAEELQHIAMSLDLAIDGMDADPAGDETARRFALADQARRELQTLAATLTDGTSDVTPGARPAQLDGAVSKSASYTLRDPAPER